MLTHHTPAGICPPFANYSHGVEVAPGARFVFCSGQLGIDPEKDIPPGIEDQTRLCFENIGAILGSAGMGLGDIVRLNAFVIDRSYLAGYMAVRDQYVADPPPASTLVIASGFARPEFLIEIEAIAARIVD